MKYATSVLLTLLSLVSGGPAFAQPDEVRELNAQGLEAFAEGRFAEAAELFGRAYSLHPQPELLKNQAIAYYKADQCTGAVESAHQYRMLDQLQPGDAEELDSLIGACKVKLAREALDAGSLELAERLLDDVDAMNPDPVLRDRSALVRVELAKRRAAETPPSDPAVDEEADAKPLAVDEVTPREIDAIEVVENPEEPTTRGWPLVGMGGFILAGAIVYHVTMAAVVEPDFEETARRGVDRARYDRLDRSLRLANVLVPTLYGVGGAVALTGFVLVATSGSADAAEEEVVMLGVTGRF